jgi:hypothetical protein
MRVMACATSIHGERLDEADAESLRVLGNAFRPEAEAGEKERQPRFELIPCCRPDERELAFGIRWRCLMMVTGRTRFAAGRL